jgi:protein tyrosine phosphatase (PTP) superfamily phosphohydrolase (DUF442 family)
VFLEDAMSKVVAALLALLPLAACTQKAAPAPDDAGVLALGIKNAVLVEPHLVSGGAYTEEQFAKLPGLGYQTVIQLKPAGEEGSGWEEAKAKELGLSFVRIPVAGAAGLTEENARKLDAALRQRGPGGTLVACNSGNRVGGLFALRARFCDGAAPEKALEVGKKAGLAKAEPDVRKVLGLPEAK